MKKKLNLAVDRLAVESFTAGETSGGEKGTVHAAHRPCTSWNTCQCPTSPYICGTFPYTEGSCVLKDGAA